MPHVLGDLVEERRAVLADEFGHGLRLSRSDEPDRIGRQTPTTAARCAAPASVMGVERTGEAPRPRPASRRGVLPRRCEPRPDEAPGAAMLVQPLRLVLGDARRDDLGLPGARRRFEALELREHRRQRIGSLHARTPAALAAIRTRNRRKSRAVHRLDLGAQALDGVAMNAREQAALAPLLLAPALRA